MANAFHFLSENIPGVRGQRPRGRHQHKGLPC
jgi:hypothetical protein